MSQQKRKEIFLVISLCGGHESMKFESLNPALRYGRFERLSLKYAYEMHNVSMLINLVNLFHFRHSELAISDWIKNQYQNKEYCFACHTFCLHYRRLILRIIICLTVPLAQAGIYLQTFWLHVNLYRISKLRKSSWTNQCNIDISLSATGIFAPFEKKFSVILTNHN